MECIAKERGYVGMILSLRSEQAAALPPVITTSLIKNIGRRYVRSHNLSKFDTTGRTKGGWSHFYFNPYGQ